MQNWYADQAGNCLGSHDGPVAGTRFEGATVVPVAPVDGRQRWNGTIWVWPLAIAKAEKIAAIKLRLDQALQQVACPLAGNRPMQLDTVSQGNIGDAAQQATVVKASAGAVAWPSRMVLKGWRLADNSWYPLPTPDDMVTLALWAAHSVEQRRDIAWAHIDAVRALSDPAAVEAYDINANW